MNRVTINEKIGLTYNASSKARDDVAYFLGTYESKDKNKYRVLGKNDKSLTQSKLGKAWVGINVLVKIFFSLKAGDIIFVQSSFKIVKKLDIIRKLRKSKSILLIHDLDALRDSYEDTEKNNKEIQILNKQDVVIVHNDAMIQELKRRNCQAKMVSLKMFDYYTEISEIKRKYQQHNKEICFAGNLDPLKTGFLYKLDADDTKITINVYGKKEKEFSKLCYCGCYKPEELPSVLQGQFGLIWEGNDYQYCEDEHPYIMFNNPHKASLYIVSCLPIIVWEKAAIAEFIKEKKIGITINNLKEIEAKINSITEEEYGVMMENIKIVRKELIDGKYLHQAIEQAEKLIMKSKIDRKI